MAAAVKVDSSHEAYHPHAGASMLKPERVKEFI